MADISRNVPDVFLDAREQSWIQSATVGHQHSRARGADAPNGRIRETRRRIDVSGDNFDDGSSSGVVDVDLIVTGVVDKGTNGIYNTETKKSDLNAKKSFLECKRTIRRNGVQGNVERGGSSCNIGQSDCPKNGSVLIATEEDTRAIGREEWGRAGTTGTNVLAQPSVALGQ